MAHRAPKSGSFSIETLTATVLAAIRRQLVAVASSRGGGRPLLPASIRLRIALVAAAPGELGEAGDVAPWPPAPRFRLAAMGEPADAIASIAWRIAAPDTPCVMLEMTDDP